MALNASGPISLAGTTIGQSISLELGATSITQISLNDTSVRLLAGASSGTITMPTNFFGKSVPYADTYVGTSVYAAPVATAFSSYTFPSVALTGGGTKIIVVTYEAGATPPPSITSATIAGVSATVYAPFAAPVYSGWERCDIIRVTGVSAQSGNVVLNFGANLNTFGTPYFTIIRIHVYTTSKQTTFDTTATSIEAGNSAISVTGNANNRANAFVIVGGTFNSQVGITGTSLTTDSSVWQSYGGGNSNFVSASRTPVSTSFIVTSGIMTYGQLTIITVA